MRRIASAARPRCCCSCVFTDRQHRAAGPAPRARRPRPLQGAHDCRTSARCCCAFLAGPWARDEQLRAVHDRRRTCWWSASCCGRSPGSPTAASGPRRPASATSSTWRSSRPVPPATRRRRAESVGRGRAVPLSGEHSRPRAAARARRRAAADVPRPRRRRRRRRAAAHRCRRWCSRASATTSRPRSPRSPGARRSCSRAATAPRRSPASPPTTSATSCGCCCRWPSC